MERSRAQLQERIKRGEAENASRQSQASMREKGLPMPDLLVPQTAAEAETLKAAEELLGNKLLARSEARRVLDEQRAATFKNSRSRRETARRQEHFKYGNEGVRPKTLVEQCARERKEAEKAIEDAIAASSKATMVQQTAVNQAGSMVFDKDFNDRTLQYIKDMRAW